MSYLLPYPEDIIRAIIHFMRDENVILDRDLAALYGIETKRLKEAVRRNLSRFPPDFMFELSDDEFQNWRTQFASSNSQGDKMGLRYTPMAFTEQGIAMLSSIVNSPQAIEVNIAIMRTFVNMRKWVRQNENLREHLLDLEAIIREHDGKFERIFDLLTQLKEEKNEPRRLIGFNEPEPPAYGTQRLTREKS
jgi:ORF6N domain